MKNILIIRSIFRMLFVTVFTVLLLGPRIGYSYILEAKPVSDLVELIKEAKFTYKEEGMVFGFYSIKSCLYVNQGAGEDIIIFKNYCLPKKEYPAKGFTIFSKKFGMIDLYQEVIGTVFKRDIRISTFSDVLKDYIETPMRESTIASLNAVIEKLYYQYDPACWSTNVSHYTGKPEAKCNADDILHFDLWASETQELTGDLKAWAQLMEAVEASLVESH